MTGMKFLNLTELLCLTALIASFRLAAAFETDYLTTQCNGGKSVTDCLRLESSTALVYNNNMDCTFTVTAPAGKKVLVLFNHFELENKLDGNCADYVNFHDGLDTSSAVLNSESLCSTSPPDNVTSSGSVLTLHLVTDVTAVYRGFEILFVVFKDAPCDTELFSCSNNICVSPISRCDGFNQCGDNSDEADCQETVTADELTYTGLIVGMVLLFVLLCLIAVFVAVYFYKRRTFMKTMQKFRALPDIPVKEPQPSYPVTDEYVRKQFKLRRTGSKNEKQDVPRLENEAMASTSDVSTPFDNSSGSGHETYPP